MKLPILPIIIFFSSFNLNGQSLNTGLPDSLQHYIDTVFTTLKKESIFTKTVDWSVLADSVNAKVSSATTIEDLMPAVEFLFHQLGDKHGYLTYKNKRYGIPIDNPIVRDELAEGFKLGASVRSRIIENNYGYIFIPPIWAPTTEVANKYAQQIQDSICTISNNQEIKGWIIDLRMNLGGNMYPMIAGIGNILGDGVLGYFVSADDTKTAWSIREGDAYEGETRNTKLIRKCESKPDIKVAVLLSQITNSSGEIVAISFKGRDNTRFFGEQTTGYTTANNGHYNFAKNTMLVVASAFIEDRHNNLYKDFVTPDVLLIDGDNFKDFNKDSKIQSALGWLKSE